MTSALTIALMVYIGFGLLLYFFQNNFLYYPTPEYNNPDYQSLRLDSDGESIKIWRINPGKKNAIIYFGGNAEPVEINIPLFTELMPNYSIYLVNYRGYGGSSGTPSEAGLFADALNIYDNIRQQHTRISAMGRSLGSGIAVYLASQRSIEKLILVTPYDSIEKVAQRSYPLFPISILLKDKYDAQKYAADISTRTLMLVAQNDQLIPPVHAQRLAESFKTAKVTTKIIANTGHNTISHSPEYQGYLVEFLQ